MTATAAATARADGRVARRDRNREQVLDAALALFAEGHLHPTAPEVAKRSKVSERSVFRYYADTEALLRAAIARHLARIEPLFDVAAATSGSLEDRIERLVAMRLRLYDAVAPTARATVLRAPTDAVVAEQLAANRRRLRAQLDDVFAPELRALPAAARRAAASSIDALLQFEGLEHLRQRLGLTPAQTADALRRSLAALLAA